MIQFNKPKNLNGAELVAELQAAGISVQKQPVIDGDGIFWVDIDDSDKEKAQIIVAKHNGTIIPLDQTVLDKLAFLGLKIDDLKAALGL